MRDRDSEVLRKEIASLVLRWGDPVRVVAKLDDADFDPLNKRDRAGEVCMVVRRPNGKILLSIKTFYPRTGWRLPTGGIELGERIAEAVMREAQEETGLDLRVARFLAVVAYAVGGKPAFYTFAFLLEELGGTLGSLDPHEQIEAYREIEIAELPLIADTLASTASGAAPIGGDWQHWGLFRAHVHRAVHAALT